MLIIQLITNLFKLANEGQQCLATDLHRFTLITDK